MAFKAFFYVLHSKAVCSARLPMCEKLKAALTQGSEHFEARVEYITDSDPDDLVRRPGGIAGLVEISQEALKEYPDIASAAPKSMHVNHLSCTLKHVAALERVVANAKQHGGFHVILEDDCLFGEEPELKAKLSTLLWNLPTNYDMVFLGLPSPQGVEALEKDGDRIVAVSGGHGEQKYQSLSKQQPQPQHGIMPLLPCCDSYVVNPTAAARLLPLCKPIRLPANLQMTWMIRKASLRTYATIPNLFVDGSKIGVYVSQLEANNRLLWNDQFLKLEALANTADQLAADPDRLKAAQEFVDKLQFKGHPDMLRLIARLQMRIGNCKEARIIFDQIFKILAAENCVLNSTSTFLRDYMNLHGQLQDDITLS